MFVLMSRISRMASSGRAEISKFSRIWPRVVEVVKKAVPRCDGPRQSNLRRCLVDALCDARDYGVGPTILGFHGVSQRCKRLHDYPMLPAEIEQLPFG